MFFSYNILISKNSSFSIIWKYMHDRHGPYKVSKRELLSIDVHRACEDLVGYIPTGELLKSELANKMSLYLLAQLSYGIALVLRVQADYLIADLQSTFRSLIRFPTEEQKDKRARKSGSASRKRRATDLEDVVKEALEVPHPAMLRGIEMEEEESDEEEDRRRRSRISTRKPSMLDLTDPRAYVDQQVPGARIGLEEQLLMDATLQNIDDNFMDAANANQTQLPPAEWALEHQMLNGTQQEQQQEEVVPATPEGEVGKQRDSQKISMSSLLKPDVMESENMDTVMFGPNQQEQVVPDSGDVPKEPIIGPAGLPIDSFSMLDVSCGRERTPVYRQSADEVERARRMTGQSDDDIFHLPDLPDLLADTPKKHRGEPHRKKKRLIIDEKTEMSDAEMHRRIEFYGDTLRSREDLLKEIAQPEMPTLAQLLDPRPYHIKGLSSALFPLFDAVKAPHRERPLTFEEAQRMTVEDFRTLRLDFDVRSWHSQSEDGQEQQQVPHQAADEGIVQQTKMETERRATVESDVGVGALAEKISVFHLPVPHLTDFDEPLSPPDKRPSSALDREAARRATDDRRTGPSERSAVLLEVDEPHIGAMPPPPQPLLMDINTEELQRSLLAMDGGNGSGGELLQESLLAATAEGRSPVEVEEPSMSTDFEANELLSQISRAGVISFGDIVKTSSVNSFDTMTAAGRKLTRAQVAHHFFTLLKLLKHRKVKVRQRVPYGEILIRERGAHNPGEASFADD